MDILENIEKQVDKIQAHKVYSGINSLPYGDAPNTITSGCVVAEGGAFRAVYGEGVMDALMEEGINFQTTIGVSAGALNGLNYCAGNIGRAARINLSHRYDHEYVGLKAYKDSNTVIDFNYLFHELGQDIPFNRERFYKDDRRFMAVATNMLTGKPRVFEKGRCDDILKAVIASSSMPYVSTPVYIGGVPYLDGACSCSVPFKWALQNDFEKIVVIRTRTRDTRLKEVSGKKKDAIKALYHEYPKFAKALLKRNEKYNKDAREMEKLEEEGRIFVIAPSKDLKVKKLETDMEKLGDWYYLGYDDAKACMSDLKKYLGLEG